MKNKQCPNCKLYNSLGCPYAGSDWEEGDICDEFEEEIALKLSKMNTTKVKE